MDFLKKYSKEIDQVKDKFLGSDGKKEKKKGEWQTQPKKHLRLTNRTLEHEQEGQSQPQYGAPQPGPQGGPQLPAGWVAQWDQNSQRWYYLEQATGRTQWEPPANYPPGPGAPYGGQAPMQGAPSGAGYSAEKEKDKPKDKSHKGMLLGAAGGLAAGGLIAHEMHDGSSSDEEHHRSERPVAARYRSGYDEPGYNQALPTHTADGDSVSSSDRESVEEARKDYQEG